MAIIQQSSAVFYHPLDDLAERLKDSQWTDADALFAPGKVANAYGAGLSLEFGGTGSFSTGGGGGGDLPPQPVFSVGALDDTRFLVIHAGNARVASSLGAGGISFGAPQSLPTGVDHGMAVLSSTSFAIAYRDGGDFGEGSAHACVVSGDDITVGPKAQWNGAGAVDWVTMVALDSTRVVISMAWSGAPQVIVAAVSGSTLSLGSPVSVGGEPDNMTTLVALSATQVVLMIASRPGKNSNKAYVGTVAGLGISFPGPAKILPGGDVPNVPIGGVGVNSAQFLMAKATSGGGASVYVGTVTGSVITFGSGTEFIASPTAMSRWVHMAAVFGGSRFVLTYSDDGTPGRHVYRILSVSGAAATVGAERELASVNTSGQPQAGAKLAGLGATRLIALYRDDDATGSRVRVGNLTGLASATDGSDGSWSAPQTFLSSLVQPDGFGLMRLSDTQFVIAYSSATTGLAKVVTVSGNAVTFGPESTFQAAGASALGPLDGAALSATTVVVAYMSSSPAARLARVGTVSGTDVTWGAGTSYHPAATGSMNLAALDSTRFVIAFRRDTNSDGLAKVGTVAGTDVTFGLPAVFKSGASLNGGTSAMHMVSLSATKVVVAFQDNGDTGQGRAVVGSVSGISLTFGAETDFVSGVIGGALWPQMAALDATSLVLCYRDHNDSGKGKAKVGTVAGAGIAFGIAAEFHASDVTSLGAASRNPSSFTVTFRSESDGFGRSRPGTVAGTAITLSTGAVFLNANNGGSQVHNEAMALDSNTTVVAYRDNSDADKGKLNVGAGSPYGTSVGATRLAFSSWTRDPIGDIATTAAPVVAGPLAQGDTSVAGTSIEADGTSIQVYTSGGALPEGAPVTVTGGTWTKTGLAPLSGAEGVAARATASGKLESPLSGIETAVTLTQTRSLQSTAGSIDITDVVVTELTTTKFLAYYNRNAEGGPHLRVGTVSGLSVTLGTAVAIGNPGIHVDIVALSSGTAVVAGGSTAMVCTVAGDVVTAGPTNSLPETGAFIALAKLDSTRFVLCGNLTSAAKAVIGTVGGTNITWGSAAAASPGGAASSVAVAALDSAKFVIAWTNAAKTNVWTQVGTVSFTTISFGTQVAAETNTALGQASLAGLDSSHFVVAWYNSNSRTATVTTGIVAFSAISIGAAATLAGPFSIFQAMGRLRMCALDSTRFITAWEEAGGAGLGDERPSRAGTSVGGTISLQGEVGLFIGGTSVADRALDIACLTSTKAVAVLSNGISSKPAWVTVRDVL